jgi:hypothetical protein
MSLIHFFIGEKQPLKSVLHFLKNSFQKVEKGKHYLLLATFFILYGSYSGYAQTTTLPPGSVIIDMGVFPQTYGNALKPYGLVFELVKNQKTPVIWSINPAKVRDGVDFTVDGKSFRAGPFIIEAQFAAAANVQAAIANFVAQGVRVHTTTNPVTIPVYKTIVEFPTWVMDLANGKIAIQYLINAGIPSTSYRLGLPKDLGPCDDLFIMPHADPTWADHGRLWTFNAPIADGGSAGWIWAACHAPSVMEAVVNPLNPSQKLNFLANDPTPSLVGYKVPGHASGTGPYAYDSPTEPVMQFLGNMHLATQNGSEQVYLPSLGSGWRMSTKVPVWDTAHPDIPSKTLGKAAKIAVGFGFDDEDRGKVMYEGGHNHNINSQDGIAAQRAMLNFSFDAPAKRAPVITVSTPAPASIPASGTFPLEISTTASLSSIASVQWSSSGGGTFSDPMAASTDFTAPPLNPGDLDFTVIVTATVVDVCGRQSFESFSVVVQAPPAPPVANNDSYSTDHFTPITFNPLLNDTDVNNDIVPSSLTFTTAASSPGNWAFVHNGDGTVTFTPTDPFVGTATVTYQICDATSLCATADISVNVFAPLCTPDKLTIFKTQLALASNGATIASSNSWNNVSRIVDADTTNLSKSGKNGFVVIDLGVGNLIAPGTAIEITQNADNTSGPYNFTVDVNSANSGWPTVRQTAFQTSTVKPNNTVTTFLVTDPGMRYIRLTADANNDKTNIVKIRYTTYTCVTPSAPVANPDVAYTTDRNPVILSPLANDTDPDNDINPSSFTPTSSLAVAGGTFVLLANQQVAFVPDAGFSGIATLTYQICDNSPAAAPTNGPLCAIGTITVNVVLDTCESGIQTTASAGRCSCSSCYLF